MTEPRPPTHSTSEEGGDNKAPQIPVEIVSEEEMALIDAAFAAARSFLSSSSSCCSSSSPSPSPFPSCSPSPTRFQQNARSIRSITLLSKRRLSTEGAPIRDIEDAGGGIWSPQKTNRVTESLLHRFRRKRGLAVTDITGTEWCEKQMEFSLLFGKPEVSNAMKAGIARHTDLEKEVVRRVEVCVRTIEDAWALKIFNFIIGVNQLVFDGLTRELPIIGFVEDVWMVGVIDEIRMTLTKDERNPTLVETKTRVQATLPAVPQQRNGRLQLMCYKYLWDSLVANNFPWRHFLDFFSLNANCLLSEEIRQNTAMSGFPAQTLDDLMRYFQNTCCTLLPAHDQLLLRYELQEDNSLLSEDLFAYDSEWLKDQIQCRLEFWRGKREARYTPEEERWKCKFCRYASVCTVNANSNGTKG